MSISIPKCPVNGNTAAYSKAVKLKPTAETPENFELQTIASTDKAAAEDAMTAFKKEFYQDLDKIKLHSTVRNAAVNISDKAFQKMQADPQYRQKVLSLLQRDLCSSYAPRATSVMLTVGETLEQYRGDSWPVGSDSEFFGRSQNSFFKKTNDEDEDKHEKKRMEAQEKMKWERRNFEQRHQLAQRAEYFKR